MRSLPMIGGPLDGELICAHGSHEIASDGSVYRFAHDRWLYCGPRSGQCRDCKQICAPKCEADMRLMPENGVCPLCAGRLMLPR